MSNMTLETLTEGIVSRNMGKINQKLVEKWNRTGLLNGLKGTLKENMATLLENQAKQVLKEASTVTTGGTSPSASGDLRGFTNIAFPLVRRVFGGLVANELVSIQPMSLPSGLLFYLDYQYGTPTGGSSGAGASYNTGSSIYNDPTGKGVRSGSLGVGGMYDLAGSGYSRVYTTVTGVTLLTSGAIGGTGTTISTSKVLRATGSDGKLIQFDSQLATAIENNSTGPGEAVGNAVYTALVVDLTTSGFTNVDATMVKDFSVGGPSAVWKSVGNDPFGSPFQGGTLIKNIRRLNQLGTYSGGVFTSNPLAVPGTGGTANCAMLMVVSGANTAGTAADTLNISAPLGSQLNTGTGDTLALPVFESDLGSSPSPTIPEIDIKIEAVPVVAESRKLRAKWSPELAQDLDAYQSLDAEVELTQILSEQIAMEIDREVLNDMLTQASAANLYWSRAPGKFLNKVSGLEVYPSTSGSVTAPGPAWRGTVREWYETLTETIIDVANQIHRKTLRGSANFIVVGPDVATVLESSVAYRPSYSLDSEGQVTGMTIGAEKVGTLSNRFNVYKDPYFPRNKVLVGYKGNAFLETGYVYAPYVPLIVTPTIYAPEDFTPRRGVMTRYGKKMVRSDFYGTVTILDMNVI